MSLTRARRSARHLVLSIVAPFVALGLLLAVPSSTASAAPGTVATASTTARTTTYSERAAEARRAAAAREARAKRAVQARHKRAVRFGIAVLRAAKSRAGSAYRYGGTGPRAFDCSGLTRWAYSKIGRKLPRTSGAQAGAVKHVRKPRLGDLVFFTRGGRVYHVGIYAGHHRIFHASRPGTPVGTSQIWSSSIFFGRPRY